MFQWIGLIVAAVIVGATAYVVVEVHGARRRGEPVGAAAGRAARAATSAVGPALLGGGLWLLALWYLMMALVLLFLALPLLPIDHGSLLHQARVFIDVGAGVMLAAFVAVAVSVAALIRLWLPRRPPRPSAANALPTPAVARPAAPAGVAPASAARVPVGPAGLGYPFGYRPPSSGRSRASGTSG